jgi:myo-inositol 2-dehydrogenase / D-chiro-inositol 1-dehydrogenase
MTRSPTPARIGLAIVGAGRVGLMRGEIAARFPQVDWIGIAEIDPARGRLVAEKLGADFVTTDFRELLRRREVTAALISTVGHLHAAPTLAALENPNRISLLIEKPIANDLSESERVLQAIRQSGVDALVGYTQRFRRRWMVAKDRIMRGELGDISTVTTRAFLNRMVALNAYRREPDPAPNSPMVVSGTHALDLVMWMMEGRRPVEVDARSVAKTLGPAVGGLDATAGTMVFDDDTLYQSMVNWALPVSWPGAVYGLEVGIVGTTGVMTIDDTHRDFVMATEAPQGGAYLSDATRRVDFIGSTPAGDMALGALRGPLHDETQAWLERLSFGAKTLHATAEDGHDRLMLAKAYDLSARLRQPVALPISASEAHGLA